MTENESKSLSGWILLDKPYGITSRGALNVIKKAIKQKATKQLKIGHAGTLDPAASGLLLVAIGEATKTVQYAMDGVKEYAFEITWGENRDTLDAEGKVIATSEIIPVMQDIEIVLDEFKGKQLQMPPVFSAIKVGGRRSCDLARSGVITDLKARMVELFELKVTGHEEQKTQFYAKCGKGYYIRALARDIAQKLGVCGYVSSLRRLSIGKLNVKETISLAFIEQLVHTGGPSELERYLYPLHTVLDDILVQCVSEEQSKKLRLGQKIPVDLTEEEPIAAMLGEKLIAICKVDNGFLSPIRVFNQ